MKELDEAILGCHLCKLAGGRTNAVPGSGLVENVEVVFVGEGPGRNEDREGKTIRRRRGKTVGRGSFATLGWTEIEST